MIIAMGVGTPGKDAAAIVLAARRRARRANGSLSVRFEGVVDHVEPRAVRLREYDLGRV